MFCALQEGYGRAESDAQALKNDAADAAAICEAVTRPSMRFVKIRSIENQAVLMQGPRNEGQWSKPTLKGRRHDRT